MHVLEFSLPKRLAPRLTTLPCCPNQGMRVIHSRFMEKAVAAYADVSDAALEKGVSTFRQGLTVVLHQGKTLSSMMVRTASTRTSTPSHTYASAHTYTGTCCSDTFVSYSHA